MCINLFMYLCNYSYILICILRTFILCEDDYPVNVGHSFIQSRNIIIDYISLAPPLEMYSKFVLPN